jgi:hypothetical protein
MKSILITAAVLMTGASVYGIVDYNKKAHTREFKNLYREEQPVAKKEIQTKTKEVAPAKMESLPEKTTVVASKPVTRTPAKKRNRLSLKAFSRARIEKFEPPVQSH